MTDSSKIPGTADDAEARFYDAIARADIDALMAIWSDEEDIVCIHPGAARLTGVASVRASWEAIFERGGVHIRPLQLHVSHNLMTAVHSIVEAIHRADNQPQEVHVLATNVYIKTALGWRIVMHHASVAPGRAPAASPPATLLH
ncbi:MAG: nuclear transport factor 2 family protein [Pseudomonadota bacterium]